MDLMTRFFKKVRKTESCWLWTAARHGTMGYGMIGVNGKHEGAHRISWILHFGAIPSGFNVCHVCDVPACVRPDHLFLGTQSDNIKDAYRKGRKQPVSLQGESHGRAKLTESDVRLIREALIIGKTGRSLAKEFKVDPKTISFIKNGQHWSHIQ